MAEQGRSVDPMAIFLTVFVLGSFGGSWFFGTPFESSRPKEPIAASLTDNAEFVPARLWQDPFTAVERCRQQNQAADSDDKRCAPGDLKWDSSSPPEEATKEAVIIMPVMVYGGAYTENVEKRRRRRYAVLSALAKHKYRPDDAENIGYFESELCPPYACIVPFEWLRPNEARYDPEKGGNRPRVLLLWLDEQQFRETPLTKLAELLHAVEKRVFRPSGIAVKVTLLGPAGSTLLHSMVSEATALVDSAASETQAKRTIQTKETTQTEDTINVFKVFEDLKFSIFSPLATASAKLLLRDEESIVRKRLGYGTDEECKEIKDCMAIYDNTPEPNRYTSLFLIQEAFEKVGVRFFRAITSDKALLRTLIEEEFPNRNINADDIHDVVILVSEWDTFYGRALPEAFISVIKKSRSRKASQDEAAEMEEIGCPNGVCYYVYMRGLDGEILDSKPSENGRTDKENDKDLERAVGVSRFDYLRRLGQQIKSDLAGTTSGRVRAVGVLGSDVYDKLLVLQAFRPSFPQALFFTTDADARYLHPSEFKWARNLIVLSGWDLRPGQDDLPQEIASQHDAGIKLPPFRDSYQTSMFVATRLALWWSEDTRDAAQLRKELHDLTSAKAFEVGRSRLIPLDKAEQQELRAQLRADWLSGISVIAVMAVILPLCAFPLLQYAWRRALRVTLLMLSALLLPLLITAWVYSQDGISGEPLPLLGGANMLPNTAILFLTLSVTSLFLVTAHGTLRKNARRLIKEFRLQRNKTWAEYLPSRRYFTRRANLLQRWRHALTATGLAIARRPFMSLWAVMYMVFSVTLIVQFGGLIPPIRGNFTLHVYRFGIWATLFGFFMLIYQFANEVQRCRNLAQRLTSGRLHWGRQTLEKFAPGQDTAADWARNSLARWIGIQLLAKRTMRVDKLLYFPFIVLLLLIMERSSLFDNWRLVPSISVVLVTSVLILITCVLFLRRSIKEARESALEEMRGALSQGVREGDEGADVKALRLMIAEVENERRGAFCPLSSDPMLKALLMALGGYGSLFSLDYLAALM